MNSFSKINTQVVCHVTVTAVSDSSGFDNARSSPINHSLSWHPESANVSETRNFPN